MTFEMEDYTKRILSLNTLLRIAETFEKKLSVIKRLVALLTQQPGRGRRGKQRKTAVGDEALEPSIPVDTQTPKQKRIDELLKRLMKLEEELDHEPHSTRQQQIPETRTPQQKTIDALTKFLDLLERDLDFVELPLPDQPNELDRHLEEMRRIEFEEIKEGLGVIRRSVRPSHSGFSELNQRNNLIECVSELESYLSRIKYLAVEVRITYVQIFVNFAKSPNKCPNLMS